MATMEIKRIATQVALWLVMLAATATMATCYVK